MVMTTSCGVWSNCVSSLVPMSTPIHAPGAVVAVLLLHDSPVSRRLRPESQPSCLRIHSAHGVRAALAFVVDAVVLGLGIFTLSSRPSMRRSRDAMASACALRSSMLCQFAEQRFSSGSAFGVFFQRSAQGVGCHPSFFIYFITVAG